MGNSNGGNPYVQMLNTIGFEKVTIAPPPDADKVYKNFETAVTVVDTTNDTFRAIVQANSGPVSALKLTTKIAVVVKPIDIALSYQDYIDPDKAKFSPLGATVAVAVENVVGGAAAIVGGIVAGPVGAVVAGAAAKELAPSR
jgi:hypothetical protein